LQAAVQLLRPASQLLLLLLLLLLPHKVQEVPAQHQSQLRIQAMLTASN
jgi:hypothetical protein